MNGEQQRRSLLTSTSGPVEARLSSILRKLNDWLGPDSYFRAVSNPKSEIIIEPTEMIDALPVSEQLLWWQELLHGEVSPALPRPGEARSVEFWERILPERLERKRLHQKWEEMEQMPAASQTFRKGPTASATPRTRRRRTLLTRLRPFRREAGA